MLPIYATIKNINVDFKLMEEEIHNIPDELFHNQTVWRKDPTKFESIDGHLIGSESDNESSDYFTIDEHGVNHVHKGSKNNWRCIRLTQIENEPLSLTQNTVKRNGKWIRFREEYPEWTLRTDVLPFLPYTIECIKLLPFKHLSLVRILILNPGNFGPIHIDEGSKEFYKKNMTCINFNVKSGNQPLRMFANDMIIDIDDKIYQVNNGYPHGVEPVTDERITICVEGSPRDDFMSYIDNAVYSNSLDANIS